MGFDLYGIKAKKENGEYFRNNIWYWRPLAEYVLTYAGDCLDDKEKLYWESNDGQFVSENHGVDLGNKLLKLIDEGHTKAYEEEFHSYTGYGFFVENVKDFAEFCIDSGGFNIC